MRKIRFFTTGSDLLAIDPFEEMNSTPSPWEVTEEQRKNLARSLKPFSDVLAEFTLPSRHALCRYINSYVSGFHNHLPFIHTPTLRLDGCSPELALALAAVGAQYRFEHRNGISLFYAAKAVVGMQYRGRERMTLKNYLPPKVPLTRYHPTSKSADDCVDSSMMIPPSEFPDEVKAARMQSVRALVLLIAFATWERDPEMLLEAFALQSSLARCVRENGWTETPADSTTMNWHEWIRAESNRRTKFAAFCVLNLHYIAYNLPPIILTSEIHLRLPCPSYEWKAATAAQWQAIHDSVREEPVTFPHALRSLLCETDQGASQLSSLSPFGSYVLIHALLQRLFLVHQLSLSIGEKTFTVLPRDETCRLE